MYFSLNKKIWFIYFDQKEIYALPRTWTFYVLAKRQKIKNVNIPSVKIEKIKNVNIPSVENEKIKC